MTDPLLERDDDCDDGPLRRSAQQEREFAAAVKMRDWARELLAGPARTEWQMSPGGLDNVFVATFAKATKTYRAVLLLCDRGYGQQAAMLNRSLFEHAVVAWWLLLTVVPDDETDAAPGEAGEPPADEESDASAGHAESAPVCREEDVMQALRDHREHARVLFDRTLAQHPDLDDGDDTDGDAPDGSGSPDEDRVRELDKRFGRHGGQWHGKRLDELVRDVEERVEERYRTVFWMFFRFINHHNNYTLHHSAVGVADVVAWDDPLESPVVSVGPSQDWRDSALWAGSWAWGLLTLATLRRLSPHREAEFQTLLDEALGAFQTFTREQVADVGRNDPCPCGSGRKFKRCHGPLVR